MTSLPATFWSKVNKTETCWLWTAAKVRKGYGVFNLGPKAYRAHRLAWADRHGPIPGDLHVCHRCDVPACVNPDHMFLGTHAENMLDCRVKGRGPAGSRHGKSKLTEPLIPKIMEMLRAGHSQSAIARVCRMHPSSINSIANGKTWRHVPR